MSNPASPCPKSAILCVDDEAIILTSLKEQLRRRFGERYLYETAWEAENNQNINKKCFQPW